MWEAEVRGHLAPRAATRSVSPSARVGDAGGGLGRRERWFPVMAFAMVAGAVVALSILAYSLLPLQHRGHANMRTNGWLDAFGWWDGWWYVGIARRGYFAFGHRVQTPVAFFPAYPLLMGLLGRFLGGPLVAGFALSLTFGLGAAIAFHRWCVLKLGPAPARLAVILLLLYPFAFYLMGAVYADALFLCAAVSAFLAVEYDHPVLGGLAAAVATATRPVGVALVIGLWVLALERRGVVGRRRGRPDRPLLSAGGFRAPDAGLLLAPVGLVAFCTFLWVRFRHPFAFLEATSAPGWDQPQGFHTWFKVHWVKAMWNGPWTSGHFGHLLANAAATVGVGAFVPLVFRRFGWGYGVFVSIAVVVTAITTKDFVGMGRYTLAAFPCFAAAAEVLARRPRLAGVVLGCFTAALGVLTQLHARGTILS